jgi:hypothetical protein
MSEAPANPTGLLDDPTPKAALEVSDFTPDGTTDDAAADCALVLNTKRASDEYLATEKWKLMWTDSNVLYNSPRPLSMYGGQYVLEPDTQRFTVAQDENAIVPQFVKALFYSDPPFLLKPGPDTTQENSDAKKHLLSYFLTEQNFQRECEWALETMVHQGTCVVEWGITYKSERVSRRKNNSKSIPAGMGATEIVYDKNLPEIEDKEEDEVFFTFENVPLTEVFPDPKLTVPDIREGGAVVRSRAVDFYDLQELRRDKSYNIPDDEELKTWWAPAGLPVMQQSQVAQGTIRSGVLAVGQNPSVPDPNPLRNKKEMLTYVDCKTIITVVGENHRIRKMDNPYGCINYLSANYWNSPNSMYGIGVGRLAGSDQRIETGAVNTAIKILTMKANAPYLRSGDANMPSQMLMTGLGRILSVSDNTKTPYALLPTPEVPRDLFTVLQDARQARQAATGADSMLVSGSSSGEGKMSTKASGAVNAIAGAAATRLDGPLGHFINQIFVPYLRILDGLIYRYVSDSRIMEILGKKLGKKFIQNFSLADYHESICDYDVLAGAKLAARAGQAQSLVILFQLLQNPSILENIADLNGEQVNLKPLFKIAFDSFQFGAGLENDIFTPLDPKVQQQRQAQKAGTSKLQSQLTLAQQKFSQKQQLEDQSNNDRITRDIVRDAFKKAGLGEAETGVPEGNFETE